MRAFLNRQRYLMDYSLASLLRRPAKNLGLLAVYTLLVFLLASVMLFSQALRREAGMILADSPEIIVQRMRAGRHDLMPAGHIGPIAAIRGVGEVSGRLWGYYYDPAVKANYTLMVAPEEVPGAGDAIIGAAIARSRGLAAGDYISLRGTRGEPLPLRIVGTLDPGSQLLSADLILLSESDYRAFMDTPEASYTDLVVTVRNPGEVRKIAEKISLALPDTRPILRDEVLRTYDALFSWREGIVFVLLTGAGLAFIIFAWDRAAGLSGEERREIGLLKAVGWETSDVIHMKFWEGAVISLTAFLTGYVLAYLHVFHTSAALFEPVLKGWAVLYPDYRLIPFVDAMQVAVLFFFTVFPYTAATIVPIWRAATTDPEAVMR